MGRWGAWAALRAAEPSTDRVLKVLADAPLESDDDDDGDDDAAPDVYRKRLERGAYPGTLPKRDGDEEDDDEDDGVPGRAPEATDRPTLLPAAWPRFSEDARPATRGANAYVEALDDPLAAYVFAPLSPPEASWPAAPPPPEAVDERRQWVGGGTAIPKDVRRGLADEERRVASLEALLETRKRELLDFRAAAGDRFEVFNEKRRAAVDARSRAAALHDLLEDRGALGAARRLRGEPDESIATRASRRRAASPPPPTDADAPPKADDAADAKPDDDDDAPDAAPPKPARTTKRKAAAPAGDAKPTKAAPASKRARASRT